MTRRTIIVLLLGTLLLSVTGCVGGIGADTLTPKVKPPVIGSSGVLRAAVDLNYPPFGGVVKDQKVGLDVDVASAIAEQLGLKLELVDANPAVAAALVSSGSVDIALGGLTVDTAVSSQLAFAGTYISDAPVVFSTKPASGSVDTTIPVDDLSAKRIAVQTGSPAYWILLDTYGETPLVAVPSLDEALKAVTSGRADVAAGDALVGAYLIARSYPTLAYAGQLGSAYPIGVGVSQSNTQLESQIRAVLDKLASQGVLQTLRRKWVGDLAPLQVSETTSTPEPSASVPATPAP